MKMNNDGDKIFKLLQQCNKKADTSGAYNFLAKIKGGIAFVECRGCEVYIEAVTDDLALNNKKNKWVSTMVAAANRLEKLGMELSSVEYVMKDVGHNYETA